MWPTVSAPAISQAPLKFSLGRPDPGTLTSLVQVTIRQRITAWLCLALVLLTGMTPAQGFVVCIEADGCVSVEIKAPDATCGGCEGHEATNSPVELAAPASESVPCPCIDLAVPGSPQDQLAHCRTVEIFVGPWIAPPPEVRVQQLEATVAEGRGPPQCVPRVAETLAHIRSVVLLV